MLPAPGDLEALVLAWAKDIATGQPRYIFELDASRRGSDCGCECYSCGLPLTAVNAATATWKTRPHFRHPPGAAKDGCEILTARHAVLREMQGQGWIDLPRRQVLGRVQGLSGQFHEAWVEVPAERVRIADVSFRDRVTAVLTLDDGRCLHVHLTGSAAGEGAVVGPDGLPVPSIVLDIGDRAAAELIAALSPEEVRQRLDLRPECWRSHWADDQLQQRALKEAHRQAGDALDWESDLLQDMEGMQDLQELLGHLPALKRETLLHLGVIVFFLQIDTVGLKNSNCDKHLQNRLSRTACAFGAN